MELIEDLGKLHEQFFAKWARVDTYRKKMSKKQLDAMEDALLKAYEIDLKRLLAVFKLENAGKDYALEIKSDELIPKRFGPFWLRTNKIAKIIERETLGIIDKEFARRIDALEKLEKALESSTKTARPDDEPQTPEEPEKPAEPTKAPDNAASKKAQTKPAAGGTSL